MAEYASIACPSCGGKLKPTDQHGHFVCIYCGTEQQVVRHGNTVTLEPIADTLDKTASELALQRLRQQMPELQAEFDRRVQTMGNQAKALRAERARLSESSFWGVVLLLLASMVMILPFYAIVKALGDEGSAIGLTSIAWIVLLFAIALLNPKKRLNRNRIAQIDVDLEILLDQARQLDKNYAASRSKLEAEIARHEQVVGGSWKL